MRRSLCVLAGIAAAVAGRAAAATAPPPAKGKASWTATAGATFEALGATTAAVDAHDALLHVKVLAAPEMEGRGALTTGLARAGDYIAGRFRAFGLMAAGDAGSYFEAVDVPLPRRPGPRTTLAIAGRALALGRDFSPNFGSASTRALGGVIFAGYGITIPGGYDDYAGVDVRGKLVVCLRYTPRYDLTAGQPADGAFTAGAALRAKAENARRHGAVAVAIVDPPDAGTVDAAAPPPARPSPWPTSTSSPSSEAPMDAEPLPGYGGGVSGGIASFHLARAAADALMVAAGAPRLAALRRGIDDSGRPASRELPVFADFAVQWQSPSVAGRNVVALLPGSDPVLRDEAVVIGAHYDHLGRGDEGSAFGASGQVHPGADDNASGTAAVLEIAEALSGTSASLRPRRSILFVAFTGEEKGLIGSLALAAQASGRHVVAMLNLDMVGRMRDGALEVGGTTTAADWAAIVTAANQDHLSLTFPPRVVPNSDHASFLSRNVPALFLFTGLHGDYHRASDTFDKINAEGIASTARLALRIVVSVANRTQPLVFVSPQWTRPGALGGTHETTARLGVMLDHQSTTDLRAAAAVDPPSTAAVLPGAARVAQPAPGTAHP